MDKLRLLMGKNLNKIGILSLKNPTMGEIIDFYEDYDNIYYKYLSDVNTITAMYDLEPFAHILLVEHNLWFEDMDPWLYFIETYETDASLQKLFEWWTHRKFKRYESKDNKLYLYDSTDKYILDQEGFKSIINYIKQINFMPINDKARVNFGKRTRTAKRYYKKRYEKLQKTKKDYSNVSFDSIISAISCKMNCSPSSLLNYTIYQIWDRYYRLSQIGTYDNMMLGYYTGNIKKKDINFNEINWAKTIIIDRTKSAESGDTTFTVAHS